MPGVWRSSREEFFGADGRDAFIEKHVPCLNSRDGLLYGLWMIMVDFV